MHVTYSNSTRGVNVYSESACGLVPAILPIFVSDSSNYICDPILPHLIKEA